MSKATKRKHVTREVTDDFVLPEGNQEIVRVVASRGNNLHEVETARAEKYLVSMPTKFRKNVWIKRGDFILVDPIGEGDKVKGEIINILYKEQIKYIQEEGKWPGAFSPEAKSNKDQMIPDDMLPPSESDSEDEDKQLLTANPNRPLMNNAVSDSESDSELSDEEPADTGGSKENHVTRSANHFN